MSYGKQYVHSACMLAAIKGIEVGVFNQEDYKNSFYQKIAVQYGVEAQKMGDTALWNEYYTKCLSPNLPSHPQLEKTIEKLEAKGFKKANFYTASALKQLKTKSGTTHKKTSFPADSWNSGHPLYVVLQPGASWQIFERKDVFNIEDDIKGAAADKLIGVWVDKFSYVYQP